MAQFTRRAIMESYLRLVGQKPLDKISVKDIVEDCEITRNTFYYHFQDMYDLTAETFRCEFGAVLSRREGDWHRQIRDVAEFAGQNRRTLLHIWNSSRRTELMRTFEQATDEYLLKVVRSYPNGASVSETDAAVLVRVVRCALSGLVVGWMDGGMKEEPLPVLERALELYDGALEAGIARAVPTSK